MADGHLWLRIVYIDSNNNHVRMHNSDDRSEWRMKVHTACINFRIDVVVEQGPPLWAGLQLVCMSCLTDVS